MSRTLTTTGIVLKAMPMGEADRLVTFLSPEQGILRAIAPGSRKPKSPLSGRMGLFVVNQLLLVPGRSLAKVVQAEAIASFPKLSQDLAKLTTAQYWAELVLAQALEEHPQPDLFTTLTTHLQWLDSAPQDQVLPGLVIGLYHFLHLAGLTPQLDHCCLSQMPLDAETAPAHGGIYFSVALGGTVYGDVLRQTGPPLGHSPVPRPILKARGSTQDVPATWSRDTASPRNAGPYRERSLPLTPEALAQLRQLPELATALETDLMGLEAGNPQVWLTLEGLLRGYAQYHLDHPLRSATLIESVFGFKSDR